MKELERIKRERNRIEKDYKKLIKSNEVTLDANLELQRKIIVQQDDLIRLHKENIKLMMEKHNLSEKLKKIKKELDC